MSSAFPACALKTESLCFDSEFRYVYFDLYCCYFDLSCIYFDRSLHCRFSLSDLQIDTDSFSIHCIEERYNEPVSIHVLTSFPLLYFLFLAYLGLRLFVQCVDQSCTSCVSCSDSAVAQQLGFESIAGRLSQVPR